MPSESASAPVTSSVIGAAAPTASPRSRSKRRHEQRRQEKRQALLGSVKRFCIYVIAGTAIASSVLVIYSCKFFSYRSVARYDSTDDYFGTDRSKNNEKISDDLESLAYAPFDDLPEAGVGLFSYFVGGSSAGEPFTGDADACFRYYDEITEYKLFRSNYRTSEDQRSSADLWMVARYCSILAPIVAFLAFVQSILEWVCGYRLARCGSLITTVLFLIAGFLQFGTFAVAFAPPVLQSNLPSDREETFCFSAESAFHCRVDAGAWLSLGSAIAYVVVAFLSVTLQTVPHDVYSDGYAEHPTERTCCGGCCIMSARDSNQRGETAKKKRKTNPSLPGDTSSGSSFGSDEEKEDSTGSPESSSRRDDSQTRSVLLENHSITISIHNEGESIKGSSKSIEKKEESGVTLIEAVVESSNSSQTKEAAEKDLPSKEGVDAENDVDSIVIKEVTSIETEFVRPKGGACCFCAENVPLQETSPKEEETVEQIRILHLVDEESNLSEESEIEEQHKPADNNNNNTTTPGGELTVEECEARLMAEIESSQCEHSNWENSLWKKGFDFVRS